MQISLHYYQTRKLFLYLLLLLLLSFLVHPLGILMFSAKTFALCCCCFFILQLLLLLLCYDRKLSWKIIISIKLATPIHIHVHMYACLLVKMAKFGKFNGYKNFTVIKFIPIKFVRKVV